MVAQGMAVRYERYAGEAYRDEQEAARTEGLGIWSGSFTMPAQWRREHQR